MDINTINDIKNLLIQMQTQSVTQAQNKLNNYSKNNEFYEIIITIIRDTSNQQWIKTIASSYLNNILLNNFLEQPQKKSSIIKCILFDPNIKSLDKRCLEKSIINMLNIATQQLRLEWQQIASSCLKQKSNFDNAYFILACFAVAQEIPHSILRILVQNNYQPILSSLQVSIDNANLLNEMIKMWIVIFDSLNRGQLQNRQAVGYMSNSQKLLDLLDMIYQFQSAQNIIACMNSTLYQLNLLKYQAAQLNKRALLFTIQSIMQCPKLTEYTIKNLPLFIRTLHFFAFQRPQILQQSGCQELLTTLFTILQHCLIKHPENYSLQIALNILQNVIFPFILIKDQQRNKFEQSPQDFNSLAQDCCDKQTYGILKTQAIKLLEMMGDRIQGCSQYIIQRSIQSLKIMLGFIPNYMDPKNILAVQTSFLILSVFSYGISQFQIQLAALKVILCDDRLKKLPPLQTSRIFTFLAYNYSQVYPNPIQGQNWIAFALNYNAHPTTQYCGYDFLSNIVDDYFNENFLQSLINLIVNSNISLIWQITTKIIQNHYNNLSIQGIILIISKLFERIKKQIKLLQLNDKKHTLDLNNCLSQFIIILSIMKQSNKQQNKYQIVLNSIWPITQLYSILIKWNLQDQIVKIIIKIIEIIPIITPQLHPLVTQFKLSFKINGYFEKIYLQFFNQFALKADYHQHKQPIIDILLILKQALQNSINKITFKQNGKLSGTQVQKITLGNILLILQNIIAFHGSNLVQQNILDFFNEIGSFCLRLLPNIDQQLDQTTTGRIIMSRSLNTLFLCHMHVKTQCFYNYLNRLRSQNMYHGHDTYVLLLCGIKQIFREIDFTAINILFQSILQIVGKSIQKDEAWQKKKRLPTKDRINTNIKKLNDMDKILKIINSPFKIGLSIGQQIIKLFCKMKQNNIQILKKIISNLSNQSINVLKKYVDLENLDKKRIYRKVIGIKQGSNNIQQQPHILPRSHLEMNNQQQQDQHQLQTGPKRNRIKNKQEKKKNTTKIPRKITH